MDDSTRDMMMLEDNKQFQQSANSMEDSVDNDVELKSKFLKPIVKSSVKKYYVDTADGRDVAETYTRAKELFTSDDTSSFLDKFQLEKVKGHMRLARLLQFIDEQKNIDLSEAQGFFADMRSVHTVPAKSLNGQLIDKLMTQRKITEGTLTRKDMSEQRKKFLGFL